ncbi:hypothetical protein [Lactiplantibacillus plantarum]|uniref:hypothetical protein n=1 Tax=Lactiplantibacillus plantarum TaxID=1590 RepID=UPI003F53668B
MKLKIDGENANLKVTTDKDLSFKQLVMAYSLVTGKKYNKPTPLNNTHGGGVTVTPVNDDSKEIVLHDTPETVERLKTSLKEHWPKLNHIGGPVRGDLVQAKIECPNCGYDRDERVKFGYSYWHCPHCDTKLFMAWATGIRGETDEDGHYYVLNREYRPNWMADDTQESDERVEDGPAKPNAFSTLPEIKEYLDKLGVDYSQARLKNDFVRLLEAN